MTNWEDLKEREDLNKTANYRKHAYEQITVKKEDIHFKEDDGWKTHKVNKNSVIMRKAKKIGDSFEDEIWTVFYNMGFKVMNESRDFKVSYSKNNPNLTKQLDVVAIDDEVVLMIECKE